MSTWCFVLLKLSLNEEMLMQVECENIHRSHVKFSNLVIREKRFFFRAINDKAFPLFQRSAYYTDFLVSAFGSTFIVFFYYCWCNLRWLNNLMHGYRETGGKRNKNNCLRIFFVFLVLDFAIENPFVFSMSKRPWKNQQIGFVSMLLLELTWLNKFWCKTGFYTDYRRRTMKW